MVLSAPNMDFISMTIENLNSFKSEIKYRHSFSPAIVLCLQNLDQSGSTNAPQKRSSGTLASFEDGCGT